MLPNPPFQPLTLSVEEWNDCTLRGRPSMIAALKREVEAWATCAANWQGLAQQFERDIDKERQEATSLRQRLEEAKRVALKVGQRCAQLQKESDEWQAEAGRIMDARNERASQAEAALEEMRHSVKLEKCSECGAVAYAFFNELGGATCVNCEHNENAATEDMLNDFEAWLSAQSIAICPDKQPEYAAIVLAELQRRRSAPGQENA